MSRLIQSIHLCFFLFGLLLTGGTISSVCLPTYGSLVSSRHVSRLTQLLYSDHKKVAKNDLSVQLEFQVMSFQSYICFLNLGSFQYLMTTLIRPSFLITIYDCGFVRFCLQRNTLAVVTFIVVASTADHAIAVYVATCKLSFNNRAIHR